MYDCVIAFTVILLKLPVWPDVVNPLTTKVAVTGDPAGEKTTL
jgi:hypothetical protein